MACVEDSVVVNSIEGAVSDKVRHNVRGLTNLDHEVMPHLTTDVASCSHQIGPDDVTDDDVNHRLSETKTANWCRTARSLIPLHIIGAGNCLEVACAVALWGCSLPASLLRRLIYVTLVEFGSLRYVDRWQRQRCTERHDDDTVLLRCGDDSWEHVVKHAQPLQQQQHDTSLFNCHDSFLLSDAVQVFALANILRRPIVVTQSSSDAGPRHEDIGGIYLPLLWSHDECVRCPLVFAYVDAKFIPLVGGRGLADMPSALDIVPLVSAQLEPLRVWFLLDDEEREVYSLMQRYMDITEVNLCQEDSISMVLGARLKYRRLEDKTSNSAAVNTRQAAVPTESSLNHLPQTLLPAGVGTSNRQASSPVDMSVTTTPCRDPYCTNFASSFVYPYCYEHIDRRIVENTRAEVQQQPTTTIPPDASVMTVGCKQPGCCNLCSVFVYPYCYEHIESKISEQSPQDCLMSISPDDCIYPNCSNHASVNTYPVCYQHLDFFSKQQPLPPHLMQSQLSAGTEVRAELQQSSPKYDKMMTELEKRTKSSAAKCRSVDCDNYGNSRCEGHCHECYHMIQMTRRY